VSETCDSESSTEILSSCALRPNFFLVSPSSCQISNDGGMFVLTYNVSETEILMQIGSDGLTPHASAVL
jgi:non-ribosomal peptide synthetase component E (peptide arylation enzyme)